MAVGGARRGMRMSVIGVITASTVAALAVLLSSSPAAAQPSSSTIPQLGASTAAAPKDVCAAASVGMFSCFAAKPGGIRPFTHSSPIGGLTPTNIRSAYNLATSTSANTVAVVDAYETPNAESDLAAYRGQYGLPACTTANGCFAKVGQTGSATSLPAATNIGGWSTETSLDLDAVSAACPSCHILLVEANDASSNLFAAVKTATDLGAKFVTMSWGSHEFGSETAYDAAYFNAPGVAYFASTGDSGYQDGPSYPATSNSVIAVGGTSIEADSSTRGWYEQAWGTTLSDGGGSGCSAYESKPAFQSIISNAICAGRAEADISAAADPDYGGLSIYEAATGGWDIIGGTSEASPLVAAMYASAGTPASTPIATLYANATSFNDITVNGNGNCGTTICTAATGWDGPTGLGTPNGTNGFGAIAGAPPVVTPPPPVVTPPPVDVVTVHNPGTIRTFAGSAAAVNVLGHSSTGAALRYAAAGLPVGERINANGTLTGVPTRPGTYHVTVRATDPAGKSGAMAFAWVIANHRIVVTATPKITGSLKRGATVKVAAITFRQDTVHGVTIHPKLAVQWYVDGHAIRGAVRTSFKIPATYRGHRVQFRIWASYRYATTYVYVTARSAVIK
jgi:Putative Ig domain